MKMFFSALLSFLSLSSISFADPGCSATAANQLYKKGSLVLLAVDACQEQVFAKLGLKKYSAEDITSDRAAYQRAQLSASQLGASAEQKLEQFVAARQAKRDAYLKAENAARKKIGLKELTMEDVFQDGESAKELAQEIVAAAAPASSMPNPDAPVNVGYPESGMGLNSNAWFCNIDAKMYFEVSDEEPGKEKVPAALGFKSCRPTDGLARMNQTFEMQNDRGYDFFSVCDINGKKMRCDQAPYHF